MMSQDERDVMALIESRLKQQGADEFWRRLFSRNSESIDFAGRINRSEMDAYSRAMWFANQYGQDWLSVAVERKLSLSGSLHGKAREEGVKAMTGSVEQQTRSLLRLRKVQ